MRDKLNKHTNARQPFEGKHPPRQKARPLFRHVKAVPVEFSASSTSTETPRQHATHHNISQIISNASSFIVSNAHQPAATLLPVPYLRTGASSSPPCQQITATYTRTQALQAVARTLVTHAVSYARFFLRTNRQGCTLCEAVSSPRFRLPT